MTEGAGTGLTDWVVCGVYLAGMAALGLAFYRRGETAEGYFLAGRRMGWPVVGLSLMATLTAGIAFIGVPAGGMRFGLAFLWVLAGIPVALPLIYGVFIPFYHKLNVYTAYEYLEYRFDLRVRLLTSAVFVFWRLAWMAVAVYVPSLAVSAMTDGAVPVWAVVLPLGLLATAYTAAGGLRAVMWTDVVQVVVMGLGVTLILAALVNRTPGGFAGIGEFLAASGKGNLLPPGRETAGPVGLLNHLLYSDFTVIAVVLSFTVGKLGNYGADQVMIQRYLSARSVGQSRAGFLFNCVIYLVFMTAMVIVGLALLAYSRHAPFPEGMRPDRYLPWFAARALPAGGAGLIVAAMFAATMSSVDSGVNACVNALTNDFYVRLGRGRFALGARGAGAEQPGFPIAMARALVVLLGIVATVMGCFVGHLGTVLELVTKLINGFSGPLLGVFLLGMFSRRARAGPVAAGLCVGTAATALTILAGPLSRWLEALGGAAVAVGPILAWFDLGMFWPNVTGLGLTVAVGWLASILGTTPGPRADWTWRGVMGGRCLGSMRPGPPSGG